MRPPGPTRQTLFMVEAYLAQQAGVELPDSAADVDGDVVVEFIDIPSDEVVLFLVIAADAGAAGEIIRQRGLRPIRVVAAHRSRGSRTEQSRPGAGLGNHPM